MRTPFVERRVLPPERRLVGPAVLLSDDATTIIPPNWEAVGDNGGNLLLYPSANPGKVASG